MTKRVGEVRAGDVIVIGGSRRYSGVSLRVTHIRKSRRYHGFYQVQFERAPRSPGELAEQAELRRDEDVTVVEAAGGKRRRPGGYGSSMQSGFRDIAQRLVQAEENFIASLMEFGGITKEEAIRVFDLYRREKIIKRDAVGGRYHVTHGAFLDRDAIRRALALSATGGKRRAMPSDKRRASDGRVRLQRIRRLTRGL